MICITCLHCGKTKEVRTGRKSQKYCSRKCYYLSLIKSREHHRSKNHRNYVKYISKNNHKKREMWHLYSRYGTAKNIPDICKKTVAIQRAIKRNNLTQDVVTKISEGRTHETYI